MDAKKCTICESELDDEAEMVIRGYIGIIPVAFCCTCGTGIFDMADQREEIMEECGEVMDKERVEKALKDLSILSAQIGNAKLRKLYRKPLEEFIKEAGKKLGIL